MKRHLQLVFYLTAILLLLAFTWGKPTWEEVNKTIDRKFPSVAHIGVDKLANSLGTENGLILIDVREKEEFVISHLPHAIHVTRAATVDYPRDTPIVVYCSVGVRSADFSEKLNKLGFTRVLNLRGSIFAWGNKGYPLLRGKKPVNVVHPYNEKWGSLLKKELHLYKLEDQGGNQK